MGPSGCFFSLLMIHKAYRPYISDPEVVQEVLVDLKSTHTIQGALPHTPKKMSRGNPVESPAVSWSPCSQLLHIHIRLNYKYHLVLAASGASPPPYSREAASSACSSPPSSPQPWGWSACDVLNWQYTHDDDWYFLNCKIKGLIWHLFSHGEYFQPQRALIKHLIHPIFRNWTNFDLVSARRSWPNRTSPKLPAPIVQAFCSLATIFFTKCCILQTISVYGAIATDIHPIFLVCWPTQPLPSYNEMSTKWLVVATIRPGEFKACTNRTNT